MQESRALEQSGELLRHSYQRLLNTRRMAYKSACSLSPRKSNRKPNHQFSAFGVMTPWPNYCLHQTRQRRIYPVTSIKCSSEMKFGTNLIAGIGRPPDSQFLSLWVYIKSRNASFQANYSTENGISCTIFFMDLVYVNEFYDQLFFWSKL